jgi:hypothetical protein
MRGHLLARQFRGNILVVTQIRKLAKSAEGISELEGRFFSVFFETRVARASPAKTARLKAGKRAECGEAAKICRG